MGVLVSIICPVYNASDHLRECVSSVLNQSSKDWELILINDGSTDDSGAICDELAQSDKRIKVLHKPNGGQMKARIDGINISTGDYILFLDSDDVFYNDAIVTVAEHIKSNANIDVLLFNADTFPKHDSNKSLPFNKINLTLKNSIDIMKYSFGNQMFGYLWMYSFKKSLMLKTIDKENQFIGIRYTEDAAFIYNALSFCNLMQVINTTIYAYRDNPHSITRNLTDKDRIDRFYVFDYIYSKIFEHQSAFELSKSNSIMISWAMFSMLEHIRDKKLFKAMFNKARSCVIFKKVCKNIKADSRRFKIYRFLLGIKLPSLFYSYSHIFYE